MPASWGSFQSAIQLVVGANLALFALPKLRQPVIETETGRWEALLQSVLTVDADRQTAIRSAHVRFITALYKVEGKIDAVKGFSLATAAFAAIMFPTP
jgi:hypothetical protein